MRRATSGSQRAAIAALTERINSLEAALSRVVKGEFRCEVDLDQHISHADAVMAQLTGRSVAALNRLRLADLFPQCPRLLKTILDHHVKGTPYAAPTKVMQTLPLGADERFLELSFRPKKDASGKVRGFRLTGRDVTPEKLALTERSMRTLFEAIERLRISYMHAYNLRGQRFSESTLIGGVTEHMVQRLGYTIQESPGRTRNLKPELDSKPVVRFLAPETVQALRRCLAGKKEWIEGDVLARDGTRHPARLSIVRYPGEWGNANFAVIIVDRSDDLATLRHLSERLVESEEKYRGLFEKAGDPIILNDFEGRILDCNRRACEVYGYSREEMCALNLRGWLTSDSMARVPSHHERLRRDGHAVVWDQHRTRDGRILDMEVHLSLIKIGGRDVVFADFHDISARKRAEDALRESEARYRAIVEDQTELICRFRPDGVLTFVNDAYCRWFAKRCEDLVGKTFYPLIPEEDQARVARGIATLSRDNPVVTIEHRVIAPDGDIRWQQWTNRATYDEQGHPVEYQAVGRDTTAQKLLQRQVQQTARLAAVGTLAAGVAHEVNNPVAVIVLDLLRLQRQRADDKVVADTCAKLLKMTERISEVVKGLLSFSRSPAGTFSSRPLHKVLNTALDLARSRFDYEHKNLVRNYSDALPETWCDATQLEQVFVNICINALEAMPEGGTLTVSAKTDRSRHAVVLRFEDTGKGMKPDEVEKVFDPFFTTKDSGTGLGLTISHRIVEDHGGQIHVESTPGKGSSVSVILPISRGAHPTKEHSDVARP